MENRKLPAILAVVGLIVAVGLFLVLNDDTADEDTELSGGTPSAEVADDSKGHRAKQNSGGKAETKQAKPGFAKLEVEGGEPVGGVKQLEFTEGEEIRIEVTSDAFAHLHLHGYDVFSDAEPGKPAKFVLPADIGGVFELEEENTAVQIAEVSVVPG